MDSKGDNLNWKKSVLQLIDQSQQTLFAIWLDDELKLISSLISNKTWSDFPIWFFNVFSF